MALRPLGHRILVKPDEQPDQTDSGLVLPTDRDHVPVSGVVVAVGDGPERDARIRAKTIARCIAIVEEMCHECPTDDFVSVELLAELGRYKNQVEQFESSVHVWDRVVYPADSGLAMSEDGQHYILLNEEDVVVIATEEENEVDPAVLEHTLAQVERERENAGTKTFLEQLKEIA